MPDALPPGAVWAREADGKVVVRATRVARPLRMDGRLDDEAYREVPAITEMIQATPVPGAPSTDRTEAWVLFDEENLYISLRCWQDPTRIVGNDMRRDNNNISRHDHIAIAFDTFYDGRNGYQFNISAAGGLRDGLVTNERYDANWNGVWDGAASRFDGGWTAEMAIPFKTLRYAPGRSQTWHLQIRRFLAAKNETVYSRRCLRSSASRGRTGTSSPPRWSGSRLLLPRSTSTSSRTRSPVLRRTIWRRRRLRTTSTRTRDSTGSMR